MTPPTVPPGASDMCDRWDALARHLTHLDDDDTAHHQAVHRAGCPECQAWTPTPHLARNPDDDPKDKP